MRRLLAAAQCQHIGVVRPIRPIRPIRRTQTQFRSPEGVEAAVRLAGLQVECAAVVLLFDGEADCPGVLAARVRTWAQEAANGKPCDVVVAYRECETWFLGALESLCSRYGIAKDAMAPTDRESKRDAKGELERFMPTHRACSETGDQPAMSASLDLALAHRRNGSFRKLVKTVGALRAPLRQSIPEWPPASWRP